MSDIEIPDREWQEFCEGFTRQHHGWLVSLSQLQTRELEAGGSVSGATHLFAGTRPLEEIRAGYSDDHAEIMVTVGAGTDETSFLIEGAVALYTLRNGSAHRGLRIDSANGATTLVEFRTPVRPESLDGLAENEIPGRD